MIVALLRTEYQPRVSRIFLRFDRIIVCFLDEKAGLPHRRRRLRLPMWRGLQTDRGGLGRILRLFDLFAHRRFLRERKRPSARNLR